MGVSKVQYDGKTLIDLTEDTVSPNNLLRGATAHAASGERIEGDATKESIGLGNVDNTSDMDKPVSTAQQAALDDLYQQMTAYTRQRIADLINGAPESLDTLKEVSDAIAAHKTIMDALDAAIGKKASAAEFDSHVKDTTAHITSAERTSWTAKLATDGDASNVTTAFTQASTRANLITKEKLSVSMGKIMKWLADLANGAASTLLGTNLTASRALVSNASGKVGVSSVTATELGYLAGTKSKVQDQLDELNTGLTIESLAITPVDGFTIDTVSTHAYKYGKILILQLHLNTTIPDGFAAKVAELPSNIQAKSQQWFPFFSANGGTVVARAHVDAFHISVINNTGSSIKSGFCQMCFALR